MNQRLAAISNVPEYTVSEISGAVKRTLEGAFGRIRVRGEITELKRYPSGHIYLCLKDEGAKLSAVVWKSAVPRLGMQPEEGVEVVATGRLSAYPERSSYQFVIDRLEYAGIGALLARIEILRQRLAAEGLFDLSRKAPLPRLPEIVGVVTSESGAVIQDIRTTIARRFPRALLLWPVPVQGEGAAQRIAAAIRGFCSLPALASSGTLRRPDVLIVARGGGSLEDLMAFNEEVVIRAAAACAIPLISAVGHETDVTLIDFAATHRAPTPTAAAELAVPARVDLQAGLAHEAARLLAALNHLKQERRLRLSRAEAGLIDLPSLIGHARQRLDDRCERLSRALPNLLERRRSELNRCGVLPPAREVIANRRATVALLDVRLASALRHAFGDCRGMAARILARLNDAPLRAALREAKARLHGLDARLESVSHEAVLKRGYAMVFDRGGHPFTSAAAISPGTKLSIRFSDGRVDAVASGRPRAEDPSRSVAETTPQATLPL